jgi:hypothetical protein
MRSYSVKLRKAMTLALAAGCLALLAACGSNRVEVQVVKPPASRLVCKAEPDVPTAETDATVAKFIADLVDAGRSCRSQLQFVREYFDKL